MYTFFFYLSSKILELGLEVRRKIRRRGVVCSHRRGRPEEVEEEGEMERGTTGL